MNQEYLQQIKDSYKGFTETERHILGMAQLERPYAYIASIVDVPEEQVRAVVARYNGGQPS